MTESELNTEERRLWIGNLDTRISEYQLLKIMQKCGHIEKFDMLFHKTGPLAGQPRGYAFVTYRKVNEANDALKKLHGKMIGTKAIVIRLAKNIIYDDMDRPKTKIEIPVLAAGSSTDHRKYSKEITIQAIEAKLKMLENKSDDFEVNKSLTNEVPLIQKYQYNRKNNETRVPNSRTMSRGRHSHPYNRRQRR